MKEIKGNIYTYKHMFIYIRESKYYKMQAFGKSG